MSDNETPIEIHTELAKPENAEEYIEQRREEEAADRPAADADDDGIAKLNPDIRSKFGLEETGKKKASRYERLKRARDQYKAEAEELRARLGGPPEGQAAEVPGDQQACEGVLAGGDLSLGSDHA
jgi:hypothetical protein